MSPVKELRALCRSNKGSYAIRLLAGNAAQYIKSLEGVLSDLVSADIKTLGEVNRLRFELEATQTANKLLIDRDTAAQEELKWVRAVNAELLPYQERAVRAEQRIDFLEKMSLDMDKELKQSRENYAILEAQKKLVEDRWHKLMERRELRAQNRVRDSSCCDDYPECRHNRGN